MELFYSAPVFHQNLPRPLGGAVVSLMRGGMARHAVYVATVVSPLPLTLLQPASLHVALLRKLWQLPVGLPQSANSTADIVAYVLLHVATTDS